MGDKAKALAALHEWREAGGRLDLTKSTYLRPLFDNPEFLKLNNEILAELAEQRANHCENESPRRTGVATRRIIRTWLNA